MHINAFISKSREYIKEQLVLLIYLPFSRLSICSLVNDVRFLCNLRFKINRAWSSSLAPKFEIPPFELSPSPEAVSSELCPSISEKTRNHYLYIFIRVLCS